MLYSKKLYSVAGLNFKIAIANKQKFTQQDKHKTSRSHEKSQDHLKLCALYLIGLCTVWLLYVATYEKFVNRANLPNVTGFDDTWLLCTIINNQTNFNYLTHSTYIKKARAGAGVGRTELFIVFQWTNSSLDS